MGTGRQERDSDKITAPFSVSKIGKYFPKVFDIDVERLHRHIREKLNDIGEKPKFIKTIWGVGYIVE